MDIPAVRFEGYYEGPLKAPIPPPQPSYSSPVPPPQPQPETPTPTAAAGQAVKETPVIPVIPMSWVLQSNGDEVLIGPAGKCATLAGLSAHDPNNVHLNLANGQTGIFPVNQTADAMQAARDYCATLAAATESTVGAADGSHESDAIQAIRKSCARGFAAACINLARLDPILGLTETNADLKSLQWIISPGNT